MSQVESDYYDFMDFDAANARTVLSYYTKYFPEGPVLELASGPGVFLDLMREAGVEAHGVDIDEGMVSAALENGHRVVHDDAVNHLATVPSASVRGVFCAHFLEHLHAPDVQKVYDEVARILQPGGTFVAAVPNAACLSILGYDFWRDPTHIRFYDPVALNFFARQAGLRVIESGGNPNNNPGPPPHLRPIPTSATPSIAQEMSGVVQHARTVIDDRLSLERARTDVAGRRQLWPRRSSPRVDNGSTTRMSEADVWGELGHYISRLDEQIQSLQHHIASLQSNYSDLLTQLYPPNEVYVVAAKPVENREQS